MRKLIYFYPVAAITLAGAVLLVHQAKPKPAQDRHVLYWVDPMHPSYRSDKPGMAPDCGMALEPVYAQEAGKSLLPVGDSSPGTINSYTASRLRKWKGMRARARFESLAE
jgi:hypothetical protein